MTNSATAVAHANIALAKYWGKRDETLAIPATSSLSLTLDAFHATTTVTVGAEADAGTLDGRPMSEGELGRVSRFLDLVRERAGSTARATVTSESTVPTGAGLASSASGFAALAGAAAAAYGLDLDPRDLSRLARRGSGSAARSVFGGLVVWHGGTDDATSYAEPVPGGEAGGPLDPAMAVVVLDAGQKSVSSRVAMRRTVETSPFFPGWVESTEQDVRLMLDAVAAGDLAALGALAESNALRMHATMLGARPPVRYWTAHTVAVLDEVQALRAEGLPCWATIDAGPNVKVLCSGADLDVVATALARGTDGDEARRVVTARPGPDLRVAAGAGVAA
ncbi:diphosphomevalonate decarboxylase [Cellulomonas triticagri]|uniref:diphosphomevalonate decarboxylase n=1 Tax=Cellulomonas triticagri TaxID=2483352 RepID=A0A3M2JJC4_9CELL|nr:diphosphomevalonate decarboxylase [Cellulomonas triticagri]RMI13902.1 diphosphomevalonate decarboxylase [Cellulomonas triticagri]